MCLEQIHPQEKRPTVRQFDMRHLQLHSLAADHGIVFTPIELERFTGTERQRNKYTPPRRLLVSPPLTGESGNPAIRAGKSENHQISMKLLQRSALLT